MGNTKSDFAAETTLTSTLTSTPTGVPPFETHLETQIADVCVFKNGALVTRNGKVLPGAVSVQGLPLLYGSASLRVRAVGGSISGLKETCRLQAAPWPAASEQRADEDKVFAALGKKRALRAQLDSIERLLEIVGNIEAKGVPKDTMPVMPDVAGWFAVADFHDNQLDALHVERVRLNAEIKRASQELDALNKRSQQTPPPPKVTRGIDFILTADADTDDALPIEIDYFVNAARWVPTYRLDIEGDKARFVMSALVAQASGEDWSQVSLRLSTADLNRDTTLPELLSWRMGRRQPARAPAFVPLPNDLGPFFAAFRQGRASAQGDPDDGEAYSEGEIQSFQDERTDAAAIAYPHAMPPEANRAEDMPLAGGGMDMAVSSMMDDEMEGDFGDDLEDDFDDELSGGMMFEEVDASAMPPSGSPSRPPMAKSMAMPMSKKGARARRSAAPMLSMSREVIGGMSEDAFGASKEEAEPLTPAEPLPPRLRYAYLRLEGPDDASPGTLRPLNVQDHLWALVQDHHQSFAKGAGAGASDGTLAAHPSLLARALEGLHEGGERLQRTPLPVGTQPLDQCSFHHVYGLKQSQTLPGDGRYHRVVVQEHELQTHEELRGVPRESNDLWRYCLFASPSDLPLPAGPLAVYDAGKFLVTTQLQAANQDTGTGGQRKELNLGVEPGVRLIGRTAHVHQEEKGLVSQRSRIDHQVEMKLRSSLARPVEVVLYDRLPVVGDDVTDVEVELLEAEPAPKRTEQGPDNAPLKGGLHWALTLKPGEVRPLRYRYRVVVPAKSELVGGNRRE